MNSNPQVQQPRGPKLKFCPESNDLLYPKVCTPPPSTTPAGLSLITRPEYGSCAIAASHGRRLLDVVDGHVLH